MYLVCRLGGPERLAETYADTRRALVHGAGSELENAPSLPAFAYGVARSVATANRDANEVPGLEGVPWMPTPEGRVPGYGEALDRVRMELDDDSGQALELRHARGLDLADVAYVLGVDVDTVRGHLAAGTRAVDAIASTLEPRPDVPALVADAFRAQTTFDRAEAARPRARPPRLIEGTVIAGRFEVASSAQMSSAASVYLVNDMSAPGQKVLLHLLHRVVTTTSARAGMLRKLHQLRSVVHASVGRVLDYGWHADRLWYTTPWYEGHTLQSLAADRALSGEEALEIFVPLAHALSALHEQGVVHRDIGVGNTLVLRVGAAGAYQTLPVLTGFDTWILGEVLTADEPRAIAPEVAARLARGEPAPAPASSEDVFALGCTLQQCLAPESTTPDEPWAAFLSRRASERASLGESSRVAPFGALLERTLARDPEDRPSGAEIAAALEAVKPKVADKRARRNLWLPVSIVIAAAALLLVGAFLRQSRLRLIQETLDVAEAHELEEALEAEQARSKALEQRLETD